MLRNTAKAPRVCFLHASVGKMSLSSGGWTPAPGHTADQSSVVPSHHGVSPTQLGCQTVLMSVRVSVCHSSIRPLCLPGASDEPLQLQLSMDPRKSGEFRLSLQDCSGTGRTVVSPRTQHCASDCQCIISWEHSESCELCHAGFKFKN